MTKVMPQKGASPDFIATKQRTDGKVTASVWRAMVAQPEPGMQPSHSVTPGAGEKSNSSTYGAMTHTAGPGVATLGTPGAGPMAEDPAGSAKGSAPRLANGPLWNRQDAGIPHPTPRPQPSAVASVGKLSADMQDAHGFIYPQSLSPVGYLSQLSADEPGSPLAQTVSASAIQDEVAEGLDGRAMIASPDFAEGPGHAGDSLVLGPDSRQAQVWGETPWSLDNERDPDPAESTVPAARAGGPDEWLKRNCLIVDRQGHLQVWVRDYRVDKRHEPALVEHLQRTAQDAGRRITSITLNGRVLWRRDSVE